MPFAGSCLTDVMTCWFSLSFIIVNEEHLCILVWLNKVHNWKTTVWAGISYTIQLLTNNWNNTLPALPIIKIIYIYISLQYLWTLLQHIFFKPQESFLNVGIVQREWQEVRERLLFAEALDKNLNSCDCRWDASLVGTRDNCQAKEENWEELFCSPIAPLNLCYDALNPHQSVLPLLALGCW